MKYEFYPTTNTRLIRQVLNQNDIREFMFLIDPGDVTFINLKKLYAPNITIYAMKVEYELAGIALFDKTGDEARVDEAFLPKFRGKHAKILAKLVILDYIESQGIRALTGKIRHANKRALIFARWNNFKVISSDEHYYYVRCECHGRSDEFPERWPARSV